MQKKAAASRARRNENETETEVTEVLKLENQLCFPLYAGARLAVQAYRPLLEQLGLTYPQYLVLMVLWETDGATVAEIGERLFLDSGTLTPVLKRLAASGLIARSRRQDDERNVENWLTEAGRALEERAAKVPVELFTCLGVSEAEFLKLRDTLKRLLERLHHMARSDQKPARI
jgi:DNA-binding MarR family transcriptional regulator